LAAEAPQGGPARAAYCFAGVIKNAVRMANGETGKGIDRYTVVFHVGNQEIAKGIMEDLAGTYNHDPLRKRYRYDTTGSSVVVFYKD